MNNEKQYTEGIYMPKRREGTWFENFWYHYKWPTIGIALLILILGVCFAQSCSKEKEDIVLLYAGPHFVMPSESSQVAEVLSGVLPNDFDGNGEKKAVLATYHIYSREQIEQLAEEFPDQRIDTSQNSSNMQGYQTYTKTGESSIYLLDPWLYESMRNDPNCPLQKLSDVLTEMPVGALEDGYGVRLGDTVLYTQYEVLRALPADTVVCLSLLNWIANDDTIHENYNPITGKGKCKSDFSWSCVFAIEMVLEIQ